jgi:hypothetical protein
MNRYEARNYWCNRSLKRNRQNLKPRQFYWTDEDEATQNLLKEEENARVEFYRALHTALGQTGPGLRKFPPEKQELQIAQQLSHKTVDLLPPESWQKDSAPTKPFQQLIQLNISSPDGAIHRSVRGRACLEVLWEIYQHVRRGLWFKICQDIVPYVFFQAAELHLPEEGEIPPAVRNTWEENCWAKFRELVPQWQR